MKDLKDILLLEDLPQLGDLLLLEDLLPGYLFQVTNPLIWVVDPQYSL